MFYEVENMRRVLWLPPKSHTYTHAIVASYTYGTTDLGSDHTPDHGPIRRPPIGVVLLDDLPWELLKRLSVLYI